MADYYKVKSGKTWREVLKNISNASVDPKGNVFLVDSSDKKHLIGQILYDEETLEESLEVQLLQNFEKLEGLEITKERH